jgi:protein-tyrosine phosphatase
MARGILRKLAQGRNIAIEIRTAGLAHHPNRPVAPKALAVMQESGIDISDDYSKPVSVDALEWADLILALNQNLKEDLLEGFPEVAGKLRCFDSDVRDPYRGSISTYREVRDTLQGLLSDFVLTLR